MLARTIVITDHANQRTNSPCESKLESQRLIKSCNSFKVHRESSL